MMDKIYVNAHPGDGALLRIYVPYRRTDWVNYVALVKGSYYDKKIKSWVVPNKSTVISDFEQHFGEQLVVNLFWKSGAGRTTVHGLPGSVVGKGRQSASSSKKPGRKQPMLSETDFFRLIGALDNIKHRCILLTIYYGSLCLSELQRLRIQDIDSEAGCIHIRNEEDSRVQNCPLPKRLLFELRAYYKVHRPGLWLFEGAKGQPYSCTTLPYMIKKAVKLSGVKAKVTVRVIGAAYSLHLGMEGVVE